MNHDFTCRDLRHRLMGIFFALAFLFAGHDSRAQNSLALPPSSFTEVFYENSGGSPLLELVKTATSTLDIEIYEMNDPDVQAAVLAAIGRGVHVRIVQEAQPVGAACKVFSKSSAKDDASCVSEKGFYHQVVSQGGQYLPFPMQLCGKPNSHCFEHGKIAIIDHSQIIVSTGNFNSTNLCDLKQHPNACNRDYTVLSRDANVIRTLESVFEHDFSGSPYQLQEVIANAGIAQVTVSPLSLNPLLALIKSAKKTLQIENQYLKDADLNQAILDAAHRGVKVSLTVASACSFAKPTHTAALLWAQTYGGFDRAGIQTRVFTRKILIQGVSGYLHSKAILVDGKIGWVGSVNGSATSIGNNREFGIFLTHPSEVAKLGAFLNQDFLEKNGESWHESLRCKNDPAPTPQDNGGDSFNFR